MPRLRREWSEPLASGERNGKRSRQVMQIAKATHTLERLGGYKTNIDLKLP